MLLFFNGFNLFKLSGLKSFCSRGFIQVNLVLVLKLLPNGCLPWVESISTSLVLFMGAVQKSFKGT